MENKVLEQEHLNILYEELYASNSFGPADVDRRDEAAKKCSEITREHMKEFCLWQVKSGIKPDIVIEGELHYMKWINAGHKDMGTIEDVINLYFESLNKKS